MQNCLCLGDVGWSLNFVGIVKRRIFTLQWRVESVFASSILIYLSLLDWTYSCVDLPSLVQYFQAPVETESLVSVAIAKTWSQTFVTTLLFPLNLNLITKIMGFWGFGSNT